MNFILSLRHNSNNLNQFDNEENLFIIPYNALSTYGKCSFRGD